jgi:hypothetical protein
MTRTLLHKRARRRDTISKIGISLEANVTLDLSNLVPSRIPYHQASDGLIVSACMLNDASAGPGVTCVLSIALLAGTKQLSTKLI